MDAGWDESTFVDFGTDSLYPYRRESLPSVAAEERADLQRLVRQKLPKLPGVYGMIDLLGRLVYVGKSKCLRNRVLSYFLPHNEEDKAGRIVQSAAQIVWETQPTEFAALLREQYLIRRWQPRFNTQGIPRRQRPVHICLGRGPAEQLYTSRTADAKSVCCVGPFQGATRAARAVEVLNRLFKLRDCSSDQRFSFSDQLQLFDIAPRPGCIRYEIETCLGPCTFGCTRGAYDKHVSMARAFLTGADSRPVDWLEAQMAVAAERLHFEQAARLRDDLQAVKWLARRVGDVAAARRSFTFVYRPPAIDHPDVWYLIRRGVVEGALAAPKTARQRQQVDRAIAQWLEQDNHVGQRFSPRPETLALVTSWFHNQRSELQHTYRPDSPLSTPA
ncbi:MAG: UvrB/UvrC motif-containing protein [Pirellulaceae bacterium]|nr:UvrB/UvrC motif-containing protein [Pirellulaceae bacterium]